MQSSIINKPRSEEIKPFAVSLGEPTGIGPEVILKSWLARDRESLPPFFALGRLKLFQKTADYLGIALPLRLITHPAEAVRIFPTALPILEPDLADFTDTDIVFGQPTPATAVLTLGAIDAAVDLIFAGQVAGLVTAPIQKAVLYDAGFACPGHTEYLADRCAHHTGQVVLPVMMLVSAQLRVVPLTIHLPLSAVPAAITPALLEETCRILEKVLPEDFAIQAPRLAVAGLNPHAGESGKMGKEEETIIGPTLDRLRDHYGSRLTLLGPLPGDTLFHAAARTQYDVALCMYHDQALIPSKTLDFDGGVNVTLGLPIVRTSPDHGTALNIAGQNMANPKSMIMALKQAKKITDNREKSHVSG